MLGVLLERLGLCRSSGEGRLGGLEKLEHLGVLLVSKGTRVYVSNRKVQRVRGMEQKVLLMEQRNRLLVPLEWLRSFCGVCVLLTLALPLARF